MEVAGRCDCIAMDIVECKDLLPETPRGNKYILTIIDCLSRFAIAVPPADQSASSIISAVLGHYIIIYNTPRRILTDQGKNFESQEFSDFCLLFRIFKICTTAYHPQSNGICERFNQTLKLSLRKTLSNTQATSWDLYYHFVVFSYNLSVHLRTGISPIFLTFGAVARLPTDLIFGFSSRNPEDVTSTSRGLLPLLLRSFTTLSRAFATVRETTRSFHQREKDRYDLGAVEKVFQPWDLVRVRLKSRQKGPSTFQSEWSSLHKVICAKGVVVTLKELFSGRKYVTHQDRLSNPLLFGKDSGLMEIESNSNPLENAQKPKEDQLPRGNPEEVLMRTRSGCVVKPPRNIDFEYSFVLPCVTPVISPLSTSFVSCTSASVLHASVAESLQKPTTSAARMSDNRIRREQRARLEALGERVC